jgi:uncharacterized membrane protein
MKTERLNAFTDGVLAIVITIMVLELPIPEGSNFAAVRAVLPLFGAYALSFVYVGIYWSNHHHMMQAVGHVDGRVLWANNFLLFWISLFPFNIRWIGEAGITAWPVAAFGVALIMAAAAYRVLERALIAVEGKQSRVQAAVGIATKEWLSLVAYTAGVSLAFFNPLISIVLYVTVAIVWLVPDRRFEKRTNLQA